MFLGVMPVEGPKFPDGKPTEEEVKQAQIRMIVESGYRIKAPYVHAAENLFEAGITSAEVKDTPMMQDVHRISVVNYLTQLEQGIVNIIR